MKIRDGSTTCVEKPDAEKNVTNQKMLSEIGNLGPAAELGWTIRAGARGWTIVFGDRIEEHLTFSQFFQRYVSSVRTQWSADKACVQVEVIGPKRGCLVMPHSDDAECMDLAVYHLPEFLPSLAKDMQATHYSFLTTAEQPDDGEILIVGTIDAKGNRMYGRMKITRNSEGEQRLDDCVPYAETDAMYLEFEASWLSHMLAKYAFH